MGENMKKVDASFFEIDEHGCGIPFEDFTTAVSVWLAIQHQTQPSGENDIAPISVRDAAQAFSCADGLILKAVDEHSWMFVYGSDDDPTKQFIEHDGE